MAERASSARAASPTIKAKSSAYRSGLPFAAFSARATPRGWACGLPLARSSATLPRAARYSRSVRWGASQVSSPSPLTSRPTWRLCLARKVDRSPQVASNPGAVDLGALCPLRREAPMEEVLHRAVVNVRARGGKRRLLLQDRSQQGEQERALGEGAAPRIGTQLLHDRLRGRRLQAQLAEEGHPVLLLNGQHPHQRDAQGLGLRLEAAGDQHAAAPVIGEEGADGDADRVSAEERRRLIEAIQQEDELTSVLSGGDGGPNLVAVFRADGGLQRQPTVLRNESPTTNVDRHVAAHLRMTRQPLRSGHLRRLDCHLHLHLRRHLGEGDAAPEEDAQPV